MTGHVNDSGATRIAEAAARGAATARPEEPQLPRWVAFLLTALLSVAVPLALGAVGYGELKARLSAVEQRMDRGDIERSKEHDSTQRAFEKLEEKIDRLTSQVTGLREELAVRGGGRR